MKKLFFLLAAAILLVTACEPTTKTYTWRDLSFEYPSDYSVEILSEGEDLVRLLIGVDDDNFMLAELHEYDEDDLGELTVDEIQEAIESDAMGIYQLDVDDENMTIDGHPDVITSPDGSVPGVLFLYSGTHYEDVIKARISVTVLGTYEIILRYEAVDDKELDRMTDIATSFKLGEE